MSFKSSNGNHFVNSESVFRTEDILVNNIPVFGTNGKLIDSGISALKIEDITYSELVSKSGTNGLSEGTSYRINDSTQGGVIILNAISSNQLDTKGTWLRPTNLPAFGWVRLSGGTAGSVDALSIDDENIMTDVVNFTTSLSNTASLVATNINENTDSLYRAKVINDFIVLIQKTPSSSDNGKTITITTTTITSGNIQNIVCGYDSTIQVLEINYNIEQDKIYSCYDPIYNNIILRAELPGDTPLNKDPLTSFRWGDIAFQGNYINNGYMADVYSACSNGARIISNIIEQNNCIDNVIVSEGGYLFYNTFYGAFDPLGSGINNLCLLGTSPSFGRNQFSNAQINNNILINGSINQIIVNNGIINGNILTGNNTIFRDLQITNSSEISNNILSGNSSNIFQCKLSGFGAKINENSLTSTNASLRSINITGEGGNVSNNTISSSTSNPTIRRINIYGFNGAVSNNILSSINGATSGITDVNIGGSGAGITNNKFTSPGMIRNVNLTGLNAMIDNYTFDTTLNNIQNIEWGADNVIKYNIIKTSLSNATNNGATGSDIRLSIIPIAKAYPIKVLVEGNALVGTGASINIGIETDGATAIMPVTPITSLTNNTIIEPTITYTKSTIANRRIIAQVTEANLTAGALQITIEMKISNF